MNDNPITDHAALGKMAQTDVHEWTVAGETYADWDSALDAARSVLATEHAKECDQVADEMLAKNGGQLHAPAPVNMALRTAGGMREEAQAYRKRALEYAMKAAR